MCPYLIERAFDKRKRVYNYKKILNINYLMFTKKGHLWYDSTECFPQYE